MPKFSANVTLLYTELPFIERFEAAAKAGFKGVEFQFPYAYNLNEVAEKIKENNLEMVLFNLPAGDWEKGDRGLAANPSRVTEFQEGVGKALEAAKILGVKQMNCLGGLAPLNTPEDKIYQTFVENIKFAAEKLKENGIRLVIEPINPRDVPGVYLKTVDKAVQMIRDSGSDNAFVQFDIYHQQRTQGEIATTLLANMLLIKHMQIADNPGRHEPGTGEINFEFLFDFIDTLGYEGWIGCEYNPKTTTNEGLSWIYPYL